MVFRGSDHEELSKIKEKCDTWRVKEAITLAGIDYLIKSEVYGFKE